MLSTRHLAGMLATGVVCLGEVPLARAQVSPGPLARVHEELDTPLQCLACHGQGKGSMPARCATCHEDIAWLAERGLGVHGGKEREDCTPCHEEHAGRDAALVHWEQGSPERFDHDDTGWPLAGRHAALPCRDCHKTEFMTSPSTKLSRRKDKAAGWLGLDRACTSCHRDVHRGALGQECRQCHDTTAWKPAAKFDHGRTSYPLTGKHAQVACNRCHMATMLDLPKDEAGLLLPLFKPLPHAECSACHSDPHAGRLGGTCTSCHVTESFARTDQQSFDHDRTRYPLRGRHVALACASCHDPRTAWGKKPRFVTCGDCHTDSHAGQATLEGKRADCAACHRVEGFRPASYTVAQHARSAYPLEGRHRTVPCASCHTKNPPQVPASRLGRAGVLLRRAHETCRDCHEDSHGGQLAARPDHGACESCHAVEGWKPSRFSVADHAALALPLEGQHVPIACAACHGPLRPGLPALPGPEQLGRARVALHPDAACGSCHIDPHEGRFAAGGARARPDGCVACHDAQAFRPSTVDAVAHGSSTFPLNGAHRATPCDACHGEVKAPRLASSLLLASAPAHPMFFTSGDTRCQSCHENPHGEQFREKPDGGACERCHGETTFRPAERFDHDRDASFQLTGAHARVACAACHPTQKDPAGKATVVFKPVPRACESCHATRKPQRSS